jgi:2-dehydro-3-deoxy-D-arabinonate dehydratase
MKIVRIKLGPEQRLGVLENHKVTLLPDRKLGSGKGFLLLIRQAQKKQMSPVTYVKQVIDRLKKPKTINYDDIFSGRSKYRLLIPIIPPEVWGAGVTYYRSKQAREYETSAKGIYDMVYNAERPEIFFKATPSRCVGPEEIAYIRGDSNWSVPEPELGIVLGPGLEVAGFTIGNDLSARDIEGENPLYLPQAKIYRGSCSIGPAIVPAESIGDPNNLQIEMRIYREKNLIFKGSTNTSNMKRGIDELVGFLKNYNIIPPGTVLLTGTGIVPPDDFSLRDNDTVEIEIEKIGVLRNVIKVLKS